MTALRQRVFRFEVYSGDDLAWRSSSRSEGGGGEPYRADHLVICQIRSCNQRGGLFVSSPETERGTD